MPRTTTRTTSSALSLVASWLDDYDAFARDCVQFKGKDGLPFRHTHPNPGQLRLRELQRHLYDRVLWVVLKARQVGASSEIAAQFVRQALFVPGTSIAVATQTGKGITNMSRLYAHVVEHLPDVLRRGIFEADITMERIHWPRLNSDIVFDTANSDSLRGAPRQGAHLTECAFYANLTKTIEVLRPTVHGPMLLESTANGPGDFHVLWKAEHVKHTFIGWTDDATCVGDVLPVDLTFLEKDYIQRNKLTAAQAAWFVAELRQSNWESFQQEHPITASEAFRLSGDRFFRKAFFPSARVSADQPFDVHCRPLEKRKYAIGADPASGSQQGDRSAFVVLDVTDPQAIRTAVSFAGRLGVREFAHTIGQTAKAYNNAIVCVERNAGWGLAVLETLRAEGVRLYRGKVYDQVRRVHVDTFGWNTTDTTRRLMLAALQEAVNKGAYLVDDPRIEEECNGFRHDKDGKPCAAPGCHDDLVMAAALALQAVSQARDASAGGVSSPTALHPDATLQERLQYEMATGELVDDYTGDSY